METKFFSLLVCLLLASSITAENFHYGNFSYKIIAKNEVEIEAYQKYEGDLVIPSTVTYQGRAYNVTSIGWKAFYNNTEITSITLPNSIEKIGWNAFEGCKKLSKMNIPESITRVGGNAFYCTEWFNKKPDGIIYLNHVALVYKGIMPINTDIKIADGTVTIAPDCFAGHTNITSVELPASLIRIGESAFRRCTGLNSVHLPENLEHIGCNAFLDCSNLIDITVPKSLKNIGNDAFEGTPWLGVHPSGVIYINNVAYKYICESRPKEHIYVKGGTVSISPYCFANCSSITRIQIPNSVSDIGIGAFSDCYKLNKVILPDGLDAIKEKTFLNCSQLSNIEIPNSVKSIGDEAFANCTRLTKVQIPKNVETIGIKSFSGCHQIKKLYLNPQLPPSIDLASVTEHGRKNVTIKVSKRTKKAYSEAEGWNLFEKIK